MFIDNNSVKITNKGVKMKSRQNFNEALYFINRQFEKNSIADFTAKE